MVTYSITTLTQPYRHKPYRHNPLTDTTPLQTQPLQTQPYRHNPYRHNLTDTTFQTQPYTIPHNRNKKAVNNNPSFVLSLLVLVSGPRPPIHAAPDTLSTVHNGPNARARSRQIPEDVWF
ncbi:hypothetical protein RRG08_049937 [Elysia crispata]|uniref:Uncharacterized protein n=1 Tax=Elysia crispata TaxID=231223 RepID=A0AAE0Y0A9_9GAST|nr:hypothetical protein RRG08_049937 [Elysia crispata]